MIMLNEAKLRKLSDCNEKLKFTFLSDLNREIL